MANNEDLVTAMEQFSEEFDKLCQNRHEAGAAEYGVVTFLGNDVVRMMMEELADTANYCRMQFIKLMLLQGMLQDELAENKVPDDEGNITIGVQSFKGTKEGWGK